ncbi:MAG TPA: asparagine synthase (glutamine-hydrolyzing) [Bacteroidales bacterium]|nr:asparagine synthase (glutamine-hydrolyzing) [Bacteroidales bacterium]
MCGICGIYEPGRDRQQLVDRMLHILQHRGPDDATQYTAGAFTIGHRRLAILDLHTGQQPIFNEDKTVSVVFNGEIYNYQEIKTELIALGHTFYTRTDTEILVHAYEQWDTSFFHRLNGIFAFALLDIKQNKLILVRDHFGVKPLHFYAAPGLFLFASEQKAILLHPQVKRKLNTGALHSHLNLRFTQRDTTLFEGIRRLRPAHYLTFDGQTLTETRYWQMQVDPDPAMDEAWACLELNRLLKQAVERQLMSDVPLGVYLSGGMDSSAIVQKMHELGVPEINTFTLGFNEPTDEFPDADIIARHFQTRHHTLSLSLNPMQQFPRVLWHAEEPKINLLQGYNMSAFVRPKITVVLGGLGGDELFAGYDIHKFILPFNQWHKRMPAFMQRILEWKSGLLFRLQARHGLMRFDEYRRGMQMLMALGNIERFYLILRNAWDADEGFYHQIYHPDIVPQMKEEVEKTRADFSEWFARVDSLNALDQVLYTEFHTKMVNDYLLVEDRMSMANSIEERVPFLDHDLVRFGFSIPVHLKMKAGHTKALFRKAMEPYLPEHIIRKKKWGFTVNPYLQFQKDLKNTAERILTREWVEQQGLFNYEYIRRILAHTPHPRLRWHYNYLWIAMGIGILDKMYLQSDDFMDPNLGLESYYS